MVTTDFKGNWIGGKWAESLSGARGSNCSPSDPSQIVHEYPCSDERDVSRAIDAACEAQAVWSQQTPPKRGEILFKAADILKRRSEEAVVLMSREMGKPIKESRGEIARSIDLFRYYGNWGWRFGGQRFPSATPETVIYTVPVPLGVVSLITPWNFPSAIPIWKLAPAIISGNAVVLKPASDAPGSAILAAECLEEAGLPSGVLNIVCGSGSAVSEPLLTDERIKAVSFTGSCTTGANVFRLASSPRRRVGLEMGGKNPLLVMKDAPVDTAVELAVTGAMQLAGQKCTATSRVIVQQEIIETFTEKLLDRINSLRTGDPLDESIDVGPVINGNALESILGYIETGKKEGANLAAGGHRLTDGSLGRGFYCAPTVFTEVEPEMTIAQEEIFGPVLAVMAARDFDHAIEIANGTSFGLSAAICTRDLSSAETFIRRIDAGLVHINSSTSGAEAHVPFGGMKDSTSGFREMGESGIDFFTTIKTVYYH
ncbi:MAG: aldehyde dehydrogenase family protein [Planctomycetota bacterium]|jgi:aldehyde dehydrogenase (NAD+)